MSTSVYHLYLLPSYIAAMYVQLVHSRLLPWLHATSLYSAYVLCVSCHCPAGVLLVSKEIAVKMFRRQPQMLIVQMRNKQLLEVKTWHCIGQISVFDCCSIVYSDDELCTKTAPYTLFATIALYVLPHHTHVPTASYLHLPFKPPPTPHTSTHPLIPPPSPSHYTYPSHAPSAPCTTAQAQLMQWGGGLSSCTFIHQSNLHIWAVIITLIGTPSVPTLFVVTSAFACATGRICCGSYPWHHCDCGIDHPCSCSCCTGR